MRVSDFAIKREIRKRISPPRNSSSRWISIKKSKCGFHGFHIYRSIGKSAKGFAKLLSWTRSRLLFVRKVFQIVFRISQLNGKDENLKTDISALESVLKSRSIANPKAGFLNLNPDFQIERTLELACENSGLSSPLGTFRSGNIPSREEHGETAVFAGYIKMCGSRTYISTLTPWMVIRNFQGINNLVPRVLSYPPLIGWVGENPGNEVGGLSLEGLPTYLRKFWD